MVGGKNCDDGLRIHRSNLQHTIEDGRCRADVARLLDEIARGGIA